MASDFSVAWLFSQREQLVIRYGSNSKPKQVNLCRFLPVSVEAKQFHVAVAGNGKDAPSVEHVDAPVLR
jgi:hypothetical protein